MEDNGELFLGDTLPIFVLIERLVFKLPLLPVKRVPDAFRPTCPGKMVVPSFSSILTFPARLEISFGLLLKTV